MPRPRAKWFGRLLTLILGGVIGIGASAYAGRSSQPTWWARTLLLLTGGQTRSDLSYSTVVSQIQQLRRLETVVYTMDKIVTGEHDSLFLPNFLAGDKLLMLVHGEAIAGIDFATIASGSVRVKGKEVHVHLPATQIFTTRLDSEKTRVYSRETGLLVPTDPNLETQVRQRAEQQLRDSALASGILNTAQQNAQSTVVGLLGSLGFEKVVFD